MRYDCSLDFGSGVIGCRPQDMSWDLRIEDKGLGSKRLGLGCRP